MKVTTRKGKAYIQFTGDISIANTAELKDAFIKSFEKADVVEINMDHATSIDFAILQLMCSASLTAIEAGKTLTVKDPSALVFEKAMMNAGFNNSKFCSLVSWGDST